MADVVSVEGMKIKIMTWNINGIRAVTRGKSIKTFLDELDMDIVCFQETKITRDMLEESICIVDGYNAYFSFSRVKTGYSGVATFCRNSTTPCAAEEGLTPTLTHESTIGCYGNTEEFTSDQLSCLDKEGRTILTEHLLDNKEKLVIINTYCPRADSDNEERMDFKMQYYKLLQIRAEALLESGRHVIVLGDLNLTHKPIDNCEPGDLKIFNAHPSRLWMNQFVKEITLTNKEIVQIEPSEYTQTTTNQEKRELNTDKNPDNQEKQVSLDGTLVDSFRYIHPNQKDAYTNWCTSTGARQTNYGRRLDYILADILLIKQKLVECIIRPEVEGSDHCPVVAFLSGQFIPAQRPPALCTRFMPEFSGKQQKLASYFNKKIAVQPLKEAGLKEEKEAKINTTQVKRPNNFGGNPQAKRVKSQPRQQNSLLQFFGKKLNVMSSNCSESSEKGNDSLPNSQKSTGSSDSSDSLRSSRESSPSAFPGSSENGVSTSKMSPKTVNPKAEVSVWKNILKGPPPAPLCPGHEEPCVLRTVKKKGPNYGRQFFCCARPEGHVTNKEARCKFFKWTK